MVVAKLKGKVIVELETQQQGPQERISTETMSGTQGR